MAPRPLSPAPHMVHYFGDYELLEEIARGGMGVVYKARQTSLNRIVAVKTILMGQLAGETEVKRFRTEAEAAANLQHPNIVAIHEIGQHEGNHYFSMDYVAGRDLAQVVRDGPLEPLRAARLVQTIAEAIQYAHQRGILHRDLKPQNVLLDERDQPRITDFGLAKLMQTDSGVTQTGAIMGSPSYMPPEQAAGRQEHVAPASDVYALGAVLYHLLTGRPPFVAETPMATLAKVMREDAPSPAALNPGVPVDLATVCLKCLEKQPERRYATARALAEDLGRFLNREPVLARPASPWRKVWSWTKRRPWLLMLVLTIVLVALLGTVFWLQTENGVLRWTASHPGYVKKAGPMTQQFSVLMEWMLYTGGIGLAILYGLSIGGVLVRKKILAAKGAAWMGNHKVIVIWCMALFSLFLIVFGVLFLRQGILAHIWEGEPMRTSLTIAIAFIYCGAFMAGEALIPLINQTPWAMAEALNQRHELLNAWWADLRRGKWASFAAKALPTLYPINPGTNKPSAEIEWRITPVRLAMVLATIAATIWVSIRLGGNYKNLVIVGWITGAGYALLFHALQRARRRGRISRRRALFFFGLCLLCNPQIINFVGFSNVLGNEIDKMLKPAVLSLAFGLVAGFAVVRNFNQKSFGLPATPVSTGLQKESGKGF